MTADEAEILFKHMTKSVRTVGVTMSMTKLTERVYYAVDALLIEKMRDAFLTKAPMPLSELINRHDSNKDQCLTYAELENMMLECQVAFRPTMLDRVYQMMDAGKKSGKVTAANIKFYVGAYAESHLGGA